MVVGRRSLRAVARMVVTCKCSGNGKGEPADRFPFAFACHLPNTTPGNEVTGGFVRPAGLFGGLCRDDRHVYFGVRAGAERHGTINQGIDRVILAQANAGAGCPLGAALTHDDVAGDHSFAAELLDAETTASGITTVAGRTACFLMCHCLAP